MRKLIGTLIGYFAVGFIVTMVMLISISLINHFYPGLISEYSKGAFTGITVSAALNFYSSLIKE